MNIKKYIKQPIDGILYDFELMPEQCNTKQKALTCQVITELKKENDRLHEYIKTNVKHKKICDKWQYDADDLAYISNDHKCNCGLDNILGEK